MAGTTPLRIKTISEFHQLRGLPKPEHPLISIINLDLVKQLPLYENSFVWEFYFIALKRNFKGKMYYGQQAYDFDEGVLFFMSPGQVFKLRGDANSTVEQSGWMLLVHPDFLCNTPLSKKIKQYEYFDY